MKRVLLVTGRPGSGKSALAKELHDKHSCQVLTVDKVYIEFVEKEVEFLFFERLDSYVGPHYEYILAEREHSKKHFERDFVAEWYGYLLRRIEGLLTGEDNIVVEGYLLETKRDLAEKNYSCIDYLQEKLSHQILEFRLFGAHQFGHYI
jgi:nucleoside-triphosphatase THEP1